MKNKKYILEGIKIDYLEPSGKYNLTIGYLSFANGSTTYIKCSKKLTQYRLNKDHILGIVDEIIMETEDDRNKKDGC